MSVTMHMEPKTPPMSFATFCAETPPMSVACDGYVAEGPQFDPIGPRANFNHHEGVDRLATRSTCGQVLMAIRQGLFTRFQNGQGITIHAFFNDCDEDVCTTWFLLKYGYLVEHAMNPALNRLVHMEDALDTTAGAYPFPVDLPMLRKLAWVFDPYRRARVSGVLDRKDAQEYVAIVTDVSHRIMQHILTGGEEMDFDVRYDVIGGGQGWSMVREIGAHARTGMFANGIRAFVSVRERGDGRQTFVVGRMSPFVPFDVSRIIAACNEAEGLTSNPDKWGGGNTIGGSPRVLGSSLTASIMEELVRKHCA